MYHSCSLKKVSSLKGLGMSILVSHLIIVVYTRGPPAHRDRGDYKGRSRRQIQASGRSGRERRIFARASPLTALSVADFAVLACFV